LARRKRFLLIFTGLVVLYSCGGGGSSSPSTPASSANQAPSFTSGTAFSVLEGGSSAATVEVTDANASDTLSLSIAGGADQALFELGVCNTSRCTSNTLNFKAVPDYEAPTDANLDNRYEVTLSATDASVSTPQNIAIDVLNAIEGRSVDAPLSGATVCVDTNEDSRCGADESSVLTDAKGYYAAPEGTSAEGFELRVLSVGGTDILTEKVLSSLALLADLPADLSKSIAITPLSLILSVATNPADVLIALGFPSTVSPADLVSLDPWALAGGESSTSNEFSSAAAVATSLGISASALENVVKDVVVVSAQIAVMIQAADALVANTSTSGLQSASERAAMISSTVSSELIETIEAAITAAGGASAAAVDVTSAAFVNEILSETVTESSAKILVAVQAKQDSGELDLSDTSSASVASILSIKEAAEVVGQTGLSTDQLATITAASASVADTVALVASSVASAGVGALTNAASATALANLVETVNAAIVKVTTGETTVAEFSAAADVDVLAAATGGVDSAVAVVASSGSTDPDSSTGTDETIVVQDEVLANIAPVILNVSICSKANENKLNVCDLLGVDGNGDALTFTVSGTDAADFVVVSNSILKFAVNPDFEDPADANTNNQYEIKLNASDGKVTTTRSLILQVLNVEENQLGEGSFGTSVTE